MTEHDSSGFPGRIRRWAWKTARLIVLLYGLITCLYLAARFTIGEDWAFVGFLDNAVPWLALGALVMAAIALFAPRRALLIAFQVPIVVFFLATYLGLLLPVSDIDAGAGPRFSIATFNIQSPRSDPDAIVELIAALDADIVGVLELGPDHADAIEAGLAEQYPYRALYPERPTNHGSGLLSRYPIVEQSSFKPTPEDTTYTRAVVEIDGAAMTIFVAHPLPPEHRISPFAYSSAERDEALRVLREEHIVPTDGPLLMLCDCNMSDLSDAYHAMDELLDDTFREVGRGLGFSYPHDKWPLVPELMRLDYIWHDSAFTPLGIETWGDSGTSDHLPVRAEFSLEPPAESEPAS